MAVSAKGGQKKGRPEKGDKDIYLENGDKDIYFDRDLKMGIRTFTLIVFTAIELSACI